jgi:hypothetical protein
MKYLNAGTLYKLIGSQWVQKGRTPDYDLLL